jgi:hypothetical protein
VPTHESPGTNGDTPQYLKVHWNAPVIEHILAHLDEHAREWKQNERIQTNNNSRNKRSSSSSTNTGGRRSWLLNATIPPLRVHEVKRWSNFGTGVFTDVKGKKHVLCPWGWINPTDSFE